MIKRIIIGVLIIGGVVGGYFGVKYEIKLYKALLATQINQADVVRFLRQEFPAQVQHYTETQKAGQVAPASNAPVAPKQ